MVGAIESKNIPSAQYSINFPDIDAKEWWEG